MPSFTTDSFTGTAGTLLENHTGETGATWTKNAAFGSGSAILTAAGRVRGNATNGVYYASGVPGSADYDVEADLYVASISNSAGILGRQNTSAGTYYLFDYETASGAWKLYTLLNGTNQNVASFAQTLTVGQTYHMRLSMRGSTITAFVNGTQILQITDTNIPSAGRAGLFFDAATSDSTALHLDNFSGALPVSVPVIDPNLFFSPYNWYSDGAGPMLGTNVNASSTLAQTNAPGAYLKLGVNAATSGAVTLLLDTSPLNGITAANCPMLAVSVDGQAFATPLLAYATGTTRLVLAGNLSAGSHTLIVYFRSVGQNGSSAAGDRWNAPASLVRLTGLELDGKGTATAAPTLHARRMIAWGDSITEGVDAVGGTLASTDQDASQTWAQLLAAGLDAEVGVVAFAAQGWTVAGYGNVPALGAAFDKYSSGKSRLAGGALTPAPDYAIVLHGKNDALQSATDAAVTSAVTAWMNAVRPDAPAARLFVVIPFDGSKRTAITAGVGAVADPKAFLVDLGTSIQSTLNAGGLNTNDGIHPSVGGHATFAAGLLRAVNAVLDATPSVTATDGNFDGAALSLTQGSFAT